MSNACVKFEERSLNPSKVIALTTAAAVALLTKTKYSRKLVFLGNNNKNYYYIPL